MTETEKYALNMAWKEYQRATTACLKTATKPVRSDTDERMVQFLSKHRDAKKLVYEAMVAYLEAQCM